MTQIDCNGYIANKLLSFEASNEKNCCYEIPPTRENLVRLPITFSNEMLSKREIYACRSHRILFRNPHNRNGVRFESFSGCRWSDALFHFTIFSSNKPSDFIGSFYRLFISQFTDTYFLNCYWSMFNGVSTNIVSEWRTYWSYGL